MRLINDNKLFKRPSRFCKPTRSGKTFEPRRGDIIIDVTIKNTIEPQRGALLVDETIKDYH